MLNIKDENSMIYWYPKIKDLDIPQPKTRIVELEGNDIDVSEIFFHSGVWDASQYIGFPLFMRTDHLSGKHEWSGTCYVEQADNLVDNIARLVETSSMCDILGLPVNALVFREFIEMDHKFKAFHGLPISRERRYFVKDGDVQCHHPYWPEEAICFWGDTKEPENWKELLRQLNTETEEEIELLTSYARVVSATLDGYWSVDFCKAKDGTWYLIDCALGRDSWHPDCPFRRRHGV